MRIAPAVFAVGMICLAPAAAQAEFLDGYEQEIRTPAAVTIGPQLQVSVISYSPALSFARQPVNAPERGMEDASSSPPIMGHQAGPAASHSAPSLGADPAGVAELIAGSLASATIDLTSFNPEHFLDNNEGETAALIAASLASPTIDIIAFDSEHFFDPRESETAALIAADLATWAVGTTGSISAASSSAALQNRETAGSDEHLTEGDLGP